MLNFSGMMRQQVMRYILLVLAFIFFIIWIISWLAFHVAGGLIHLLLVIAVILFIIHLVRGRSTV
ncbi:MAG TPA: lmo0937 family membrane protein [Bryobacteraceae bacterium]